ncbi:MAG: hypothetical protein U0U66_02905 [Cytophagaceae bacterium]
MSFLRIFIVIIGLYGLFLLINPPDRNNWGAGVFYIPLLFLTPAIIAELIFIWIKKKYNPKGYSIYTLLTLIVILFASLPVYNWLDSVENYIIIPDNYQKDYVIVAYDYSKEKSFHETFSIPNRKRIVSFDHSGIIYVSNELRTTNDQLLRALFKRESATKWDRVIFVQNATWQKPDEVLGDINYNIIWLKDKGHVYSDSLIKADGIIFKNKYE